MNMSNRDPYPSSKFENDFTLSGYKPQQKRANEKPTHLAQTEEPWSRLYDTATWSSFRRSAMYYGHQVPRDSLDFRLKTVYEHNKDFFWSKNKILYQRETVCEDHRNLEKQEDKVTGEHLTEDIRRWVDPQRRSIYSIK